MPFPLHVDFYVYLVVSFSFVRKQKELLLCFLGLFQHLCLSCMGLDFYLYFYRYLVNRGVDYLIDYFSSR